MTEIAQILALPVPLRTQRPDPAAQNHGGVEAAANSAGDGARTQRFRFRVYESGGDSSAAATRSQPKQGGGLAARRPAAHVDTGRSRASTIPNTAQSSGSRTAAFRGTGTATSGASSAFLAQSIAQEQLGPGLHNPPLAAAAAAYARAEGASIPRAGVGFDLSV